MFVKMISFIQIIIIIRRYQKGLKTKILLGLRRISGMAGYLAIFNIRQDIGY